MVLLPSLNWMIQKKKEIQTNVKVNIFFVQRIKESDDQSIDQFD